MKKKFKVGQRVVVYDSRLIDGRGVGTIKSLKDPNGFLKDAIWVTNLKRWDKFQELIISPKQLRHLKGDA